MSTPTDSHRLVPMPPRDPHAPGRVASSLELFFDLVFVVAVSIASVQLHHALAEGHVLHGILLFAFAFFAIWWAWMNFTWFATSFDTDDWLYRVLTIVQMSGVLVLAAGIEPMFVDDDLTISVVGYVVMRVAMVTQWLRAAHGAPELRATALRYAGGIALVQVLWLGMLVVPEHLRMPVVPVLILAELAVPLLAERGHRTPWHPHHRAIRSFGSSLRDGYAHYVVFAAAAAFSAGIELQIDAISGEAELGHVGTALAVSVPVALFVLGIWWIAMRREAPRAVNIAMPLVVALVLPDALLPLSVALTAVIMAAAVAVLVIWRPLPERAPVQD